MDSTGINFLDEGECKRKKHGAEFLRQWRKVHLGIDASTLEIRAIEVTDNAIADAPMLAHLLQQIPQTKRLPVSVAMVPMTPKRVTPRFITDAISVLRFNFPHYPKNKVKHMHHTSNWSWSIATFVKVPRGALSGLLWAIGLSGMGVTMAGPSDCYGIKDADKRHYCLAISRGDTGNCHSIKDQDQRNLCLAQVKGQRSNCYSIRDSDQRKQCLALVK